MLHMVVEEALDELLTQWREHDRLRSIVDRGNHVPVTRLAQARHRLDNARNVMHRFRLALYPEDDEREAILHSVWCESLDAIVHLSSAMSHPTRPGNLVCPCGELIPRHRGGGPESQKTV